MEWSNAIRGKLLDGSEEESIFGGSASVGEESDNEEDEINNRLLYKSLLSDENALLCHEKNRNTFKNYLRGGK